jgi:hypothetical protein
MSLTPSASCANIGCPQKGCGRLATFRKSDFGTAGTLTPGLPDSRSGAYSLPSRIVREGIIDSRAVNCLSEAAELFYRRLMSVVDDYGRIEADPHVLLVKVFPLRLESWTVKRLTDAMQETGTCLTDDGHPLVTYYSAGNGKKYLQINNFNQRLRAAHSRCPSPDGQMPVNWQTDDGLKRRREAKSESEANTETEACEVERTVQEPLPVEQFAIAKRLARPPVSLEEKTFAAPAERPERTELETLMSEILDWGIEGREPVDKLAVKLLAAAGELGISGYQAAGKLRNARLKVRERKDHQRRGAGWLFGVIRSEDFGDAA